MCIPVSPSHFVMATAARLSVCIFLLALLLALIAPTEAGTSFQIKVEPKDEDCFYKDLKKEKL